MRNFKEYFGPALWKHLKRFLTKNVALKIISLLFATLLWGYVMMETNPSRIKTLTDIPVSFSGESDLLQQNLVVRGDHEEILKDVTVRVSTELTKYSSLDPSDVTVTASLRAISKEGTYKLKLNATADDGAVVSISPSEILVEVDEMASRTVPIEVKYSGSLPDNYWCDTPILGNQNYTVSGAQEDVASIVKAVCTIDLDNRTTNINQSMDLVLKDIDGNDINNALFLDRLPTVTVKLDVLKTATLNVNAQDAILGADALGTNYELVNTVATPPSILVAGPEDVINAMTGIDIDQVDISGKTESVVSAVGIILPENVQILGETKTVSVYADIREMDETRIFEGMTIHITGLGRKQKATLSLETDNLSISGRISLIRQLDRGDINLYVDVTGLAAGQYELDVMVGLPKEEMTTELTAELASPTVTVTIED